MITMRENGISNGIADFARRLKLITRSQKILHSLVFCTAVMDLSPLRCPSELIKEEFICHF